MADRFRHVRRFVAEEEAPLFGEAAVRLNLVAPGQLDECLREQAERRARGELVRIGQLLVERGYLSESQIPKVLDSQRPVHVPSAPSAAGRLARYVLKREIGRGGMGVVFEAEDPGLRRRVALKILREGEADPQVILRLHREAAIAAQLRHPNIVAIHEVGTTYDPDMRLTHYIAMEFVEGRTLAGMLSEGGTPRADLLRILEDVARAAGHAHSKGVVHRDLKPANVLVERGGRAMLADFGLAHADAIRTRLTQSHAVLGTPQYMALEQVEGRTGEIDARTDVYSLGVVLYEILTGRTPYTAESPMELYHLMLSTEPDPPSLLDRTVPRDLELVCMKAMARDRRRRYPTGLELAEDLERFRRREPIRARPPSLLYRVRQGFVKQRLLAGAIALSLVATVAAALAVRARGVSDEAKSALRAEQAGRQKTDRRDRLRREMAPVEAIIRETRPLFYLAGVDIRAQLMKLEEALVKLQALAESEDDMEVWALAGTGWYLVGDTARAETALLRAEELGSRDGWVAYSLGRLYLDRAMSELLGGRGVPHDQRSANSRAFVRKALERVQRGSDWAGSGDLDRHVASAYRALAEERREEAIRISDEGLARFGRAPGTEEYRNIRGWLAGDFAKQAEEYDDAISRRPHYAWGFFMRGIARRSAEDYTRAIELNPRFAEAYLNRGQLSHRAGDVRAALADYDAAIRINRKFTVAYVNRGTAKSSLGDPDGAMSDYDEAIRQNPDLAAAYNNRANLWESRGQLTRAMEDVERALELDPNYVDAILTRGVFRNHRDDRAGARADFDWAIRVNPKSGRAYFERGTLSQAEGRLDDALADYDTAIRHEPKLAGAWYQRGYIKHVRNDFEGAIADYSEAIRLHPSHPATWSNRGNAYYAQGEYDKARADFDEAVKLDPNMPEPYVSRAAVRRAQGDVPGAIEDYERALKVAPPNWPARPGTERLLRELRKP